MKKIYLILLLLLSNFNANAQIVQFSGASTTASFQYLAQQFSPAPIVLYGTRLNNSSYSGPSIRVQRNDNNAQSDISFNGKDASVSDFNTACSGTTCLLTTLYDQMLGTGTDCTQSTKANMPQVLVDTDSKLTIQGGTSKYCSITATSVKVATAHAFGIFYPGYVGDTVRGSQSMWAYTGTTIAASRYGFELDASDTFAVTMPVNASAPSSQRYFQNVYGNAHLGGTTGFHVWDILHNTSTIRHDANTLPASGTTSATITYSATNGLVLGNNASNNSPMKGKWRGFVLYDSARADRNSISNFLVSDFSIVKLPTTVTDSLGYSYNPQYFPGYSNTNTDIFNITWWQEDGGYPWSLWFGNPSNAASATLVRFEVRPNDDDVIVNASERSEQGGLFNNTNIVPGNDFDITAQFYIEAGSVQTGAWADIFQAHYGVGEITGSPDLFYIGILNEKFSIMTTGDGNQTQEYLSPSNFSRNQWYAVRFAGHINSTRGVGADTFQVWLGTNGSTLTQVVNRTGDIWNSTTGWQAYLKSGIYREPAGCCGNLAMLVANYRQSFTANAFSSFVTTQLALPTP